MRRGAVGDRRQTHARSRRGPAAQPGGTRYWPDWSAIGSCLAWEAEEASPSDLAEFLAQGGLADWATAQETGRLAVLSAAGQDLSLRLEEDLETAADSVLAQAFWDQVEAHYAQDQGQIYQLLNLLLENGEDWTQETEAGEDRRAVFALLVEQVLAAQDQAEGLYALIDQSLAPLLNPQDVQRLSSHFGKMLLLRLHNRQSAQSAWALEELEQERLLMALGPVETPLQALQAQLQILLFARARNADWPAELSTQTCFPHGRGPQGLLQAYHKSLLAGWERQEKRLPRFCALLAVRQDLARKLGFRNFAELSFLREERLDFDLRTVERYLQGLRSSCILAARDFRHDLLEQGASWLDLLKSSGDYLPPVDLPEPDLAASDWSQLERFIGLVLEDQRRPFVRALRERAAFYRLNPGRPSPAREGQPLLFWALRRRVQKSNLQPWSSSELVWQTRLPLLTTNLELSGRSLPRLLRLLGEGQAYLSHYGQQSSVLVAQANDDLCRIWGESLLALSWDLLPRLFPTEEEGRRYREALLLQHLNRHCYQGLLLDFELQVYRDGLSTAEELDALWAELVRIYFPDLGSPGSGGAWELFPHYSSIAQLWQRPLASLGRVWGGDAALALWEQAQEQRSEALAAYETLGTLGAEDTCMRLLSQARYPETLSGAALKRRCFRLVWSLGR